MRLYQLCEGLNSNKVIIMTEDQIQHHIIDTEPVNDDVYDRLKYFYPGNYNNRETHFVVLDGTKIIGVGGVQLNPYETDVLWLKHVSIDPKYEGRGVTRDIIEKIYQWAKRQNLKVSPSTYSAKGSKTIRSTIDRMGQQYPENHIPNTNTPFGESFVTELQKPLDHYRKILRLDWRIPDNLIKFLAHHDYKLLGDGAFSDVYAKAGEKFVLKILHRDTADDCYLRYVNAIKGKTNPHFPKIGKIREFKYGVKPDIWYLIPIERLEPITREQFHANDICTFALEYERYIKPKPEERDEAKRILDKMKTEHPQLVEALDFIHSNFSNECDIDIMRDNMMWRNGTLVLTDPLGLSNDAI